VSDPEVEALRKEIGEGFRAVQVQLQEGFADAQQALHGLMFKLLTASEITEIRSQMKNPPDIKNFPFWAIR
jgi:hypothetical protein